MKDQPHFEWDFDKDHLNQREHKVSFALAQYAFLDPRRIIARDLQHSGFEERCYCIGCVGENILTVRFTYRGEKIRIIGAGYWRKGRMVYEKENKLHE